jgi:uncharacterized protein with HEPN domain
MTEKSRRATDRVTDIRQAIANATGDLGNMSRAQFLADGKTQRAVIESLIVIGEAANSVMRLAPALEQRKSEVWRHLRDAYDMRILLTHEYFRVDAGVVWDTVHHDLPRLEQLLKTLDTDLV